MRVPGMVYMFISFVPWIIYWVLCDFGFGLGVIVAFIISLLVSLPRIWGGVLV